MLEGIDQGMDSKLIILRGGGMTKLLFSTGI